MGALKLGPAATGIAAVLLLAAAPPDGDCPVPAESVKRGVAYHYCGWSFTRGASDLHALEDGVAWTYNWSSRPLTCSGGRGVAGALPGSGVEFVPMLWGLVDDGAACEAGGSCFRVDERSGGERCAPICEANGWSFAPDGPCWSCYHEPVSREEALADIPPGARYLLGYNEPNFKEQANLTPEVAARGWKHVEWVADRRGLMLVGPATNFCDPTPGAEHPGACIDAVEGRAMLGLAWLERFYDACSPDGAAGHACRIDHQAVHAYACTDVQRMITLMKRKAGLLPGEGHCVNGVQDGDEFGVDCGGVGCVACTERSRAHFAKPVWLTEFAPQGNDCGAEDAAALAARSEAFVRREVAALEADPYVYRYAWFMPKTDIPSLDHVDLLVEGEGGVRTTLGEFYLGGRCAQ